MSARTDFFITATQAEIEEREDRKYALTRRWAEQAEQLFREWEEHNPLRDQRGLIIAANTAATLARFHSTRGLWEDD